MRYWFIYSIFLLCFHHMMLPMQNTFWAPSVRIDKPRFARTNLTTLELSGLFHNAKQSYNTSGHKVPLLAYNGPEPLLLRFVDTTLPCNNTDIIGYALINGYFSGKSGIFSWQQNIHDHFCFEMTTSITNDTIKNIAIMPSTEQGRCLSNQEIITNQSLVNYLEKLEQKLFDPSDNNEQNRTYIGPSCFLMGYTTNLDYFETIDFVDITLQTGIVVPIIPIAHSWKHLSIFPHQDIVNLGVPLQLDIAVGLYDWLNVGASGLVLGYIKNDQVIALNTANTQNSILIPTCGLCLVQSEPLIAMSAYIEGEYFIPRWNWFIGVSYTKQYKTNYCAYDKELFSTKTINQNPSNTPWEYAYITLASEFDLAKNSESQLMPRCKFTYVAPMYGSACFATQSFAGQLGMEIIYDF